MHATGMDATCRRPPEPFLPDGIAGFVGRMITLGIGLCFSPFVIDSAGDPHPPQP